MEVVICCNGWGKEGCERHVYCFVCLIMWMAGVPSQGKSSRKCSIVVLFKEKGGRKGSIVVVNHCALELLIILLARNRYSN